MSLTIEQTQRLEFLRAKAIRGESTREEEMEGIELLRRHREAAQVASTKARTAKAEASRPVDTASLLAKVKGLGAQAFTKSEPTQAPLLPEGAFKL